MDMDLYDFDDYWTEARWDVDYGLDMIWRCRLKPMIGGFASGLR